MKKPLKRCHQCLTWTDIQVSPAAFGCWPFFQNAKSPRPKCKKVAGVDVDLFGFLECWSDWKKHRHKMPNKKTYPKIQHFHPSFFGLFHGSISHEEIFLLGKVPCHHGGQTTTNLSGNPTPYHQASRHSQITWITISTQKLVGGFNLKNECASRQIGSRNPKTWNNKN